MPPKFIEDDSDLPDPLNTIAKQEKRAKALASAHTGKKAHRTRSPGIQGFLSRTQIVKLVGGDQVVIQFRIEPLEVECFAKARRLFGKVVPEIAEVHDEELEASGIKVYAMTYMPEPLIKIAESLGSIIGRGAVEGSSADVVDNYTLPYLTGFLERMYDRTRMLQPHVERLIAASPGLKKLPLYFSHHDLNQMNVLITDENTESGIVDWECSKDLPFGMGFHRITDSIVAENCRSVVEILNGSKEAEAVFRDTVLSKAPQVVIDNLEDVLNAMQIGSLVFAIEEGHMDGAERAIRFQTCMATYRMPQLRGDAGPFAKEYM